MKIVLELARRYASHLAALMALEILGTGLLLLGPIPLQIAVDVVVEQKPLPSWLSPVLGGAGPGLLGALAALSLVIALLTQAEGLGSGQLSMFVGERLIFTLRTKLFASALRLSL